MVFSNCRIDGGKSLNPTYRKPFDLTPSGLPKCSAWALDQLLRCPQLTSSLANFPALGLLARFMVLISSAFSSSGSFFQLFQFQARVKHVGSFTVYFERTID